MKNFLSKLLPSPSARRLLACSAILSLAIFLLYGQTAAFEFLRFDDQDYTHRCRFVFDGFSLQNLASAFSSFRHAAIWMPLTYLSYMLGISSFGPAPGAHHLLNVAFHALNAILLLALSRRILRLAFPSSPSPANWFIPCCAAAVWALHPQRAEAVAWIASRKDLLCTAFTLAGLLLWRPGRLPRSLAALFCACACMSKPSALCFPALAYALESLSLGAFRLWRAVPLRHLLLRYLPLLAMSLATGAIAIFSQTNPEGHAARELFSAPLPWRILNAAVAAGLDLWHAIVPAGVYLDYRATPGEFPLHGWLGLSSLLASSAAIALLLWRAPRLRTFTTFLAVWFAAALLPTLGVFGSFGEHARADRFLYLPAMAFSFALAAIPPNRASRSVAPLLAIALMVCSFPVVGSYKNDFTAFSRTLRFDPSHPRALAHVASEECARFGHIDRGIELFRKSHAILPRDNTASQLAYALMMRGQSADYGEIRRLCAKFVCDHSLDPKGMALEAVGVTALRQRRWREAIALLESSVKAPQRFYSPTDAKLHLAVAYANAGETAAAENLLLPLTQSTRPDIKSKAATFLKSIRQSPTAKIFL